VSPAEDAPADDVARERTHQEDDRHGRHEAEAGDRTPEGALVHGTEDVVDATPEDPQDPRGGHGGDGDEESGDHSDLEPVPDPGAFHDEALVITTQRRGRVKKRRHALVTGGAVRLGQAIALALAHRGMDVAIGYHRSRREAATTVRQLTAAGARAVALRADLADPRAAGRLVREAARALGGLDVLVNNPAGLSRARWAAVTRGRPVRLEDVVAAVVYYATCPLSVTGRIRQVRGTTRSGGRR